MGLEPVPTAAALVLQELIVEREAADENADVGTRQSIDQPHALAWGGRFAARAVGCGR